MSQYSAHCSLLHLIPVRSIFSSLYATLLRIASLLLIFFALHRRLLCPASSRSVLFAAFRPRAAIICPALALYPSRFSLSLIQFILLRSDSPSAFPRFILLYFALILCCCIPLRFASSVARFPFFFSFGFLALFRFASLSFVLMCSVFHIPFGPVPPHSLFSVFDTNTSCLCIFLASACTLRCTSHHSAILLFHPALSSA